MFGFITHARPRVQYHTELLKQICGIVALLLACHPISSSMKLAFKSKYIFDDLCEMDVYSKNNHLRMFHLLLKKISGILAPKLGLIFPQFIIYGPFSRC